MSLGLGIILRHGLGNLGVLFGKVLANGYESFAIPEDVYFHSSMILLALLSFSHVKIYFA